MTTIAYDIDEIKFGWYDGFFTWHNQMYGTNFQPSEFRGHFHTHLDVSKEEALERIYLFYSHPLFIELKAIEGSIEATKIISKSNRFKNNIYITSRPKSTEQDTLDSLARDFPHTKSNGEHAVYFAKEWANSGGKTKADLCVEHGVDVIVEDSLRYAKSCAEKGIHVVLLDCPWNQNGVEEHPLIKRAFGWDEILKELI